MRTRRTSGPPKPDAIDRALWARSRETEAGSDEAERFLDLAAFVDGRLDEDERARVAALIARDPMAAADVATARALSAAMMPSVSEESIARAIALADRPEISGEVVSFPLRQPTSHSWGGAARWSGLAAAIVMASWLGFNLGSDLPGVTSVGRSYDDISASELIDPSPLLLRDFSEGSQI